MWKFILKRLLLVIPVIISVIFLIYIIMSFAEGDVARLILGQEVDQAQVEELRDSLGLNDSVLVQFGRYMLDLVQGDLGTSFRSGMPVIEEVWNCYPNSIALALAASLFAILIALPLGVLAAVKQNSIFDGLSMAAAMIGVSMPGFWLGLLLMIVFAVQLGWLPVSGFASWSSIILPAISLSLAQMASIARMTRSSMLECLRQDYVRTARSKGISYGVVIRKHALRNALIPTITVIGLQIAMMIGSSVVIETVFAWPGIGRLLVSSIQYRDTPTILGCIIFLTTTIALINLLVDLVYGFVDPRIKAQYKA